jgi:hypothetical protein
MNVCEKPAIKFFDMSITTKAKLLKKRTKLSAGAKRNKKAISQKDIANYYNK